MHKFLKKFNIKDKDICIPDNVKASKKFKKYKWADKQKKIYGFSEEEVWNLDTTSAMWLYEHLKMYMKVNQVDLTFYRFKIPVLYENENYDKEYEQNSKKSQIVYTPRMKQVIEEHTEEECINLCIQYLEDYLMYTYIISDKDLEKDISIQESSKKDAIACEKLQNAFRIYAEIVNAVWW